MGLLCGLVTVPSHAARLAGVLMVVSNWTGQPSEAGLVSAVVVGASIQVTIAMRSSWRGAAAWRAPGRTVVAYRDRYGVTGPSPLGLPADTDAQKIDAARAPAALARARQLAFTKTGQPEPTHRTPQQRTGQRL